MSLEALSSLAAYCFEEAQKNVKIPIHEVLQHFLKVLNYGSLFTNVTMRVDHS